ncbi:MAG: hypothetical protein CM1200mP35_01570 [Chloroflexota bacterium]|nr:MAG: hypothetical protein CM1200mP35_01570 [Chloroflexota bacterium]
MKTYALRRLGLFIPTLILTTLIVFVLFFLVPGDAALVILTGEEGAGRLLMKTLPGKRHEFGVWVALYTSSTAAGSGEFSGETWGLRYGTRLL